MHKLGNLEIKRVVESEVPIFKVKSFFPDCDMAVVEKHRDWLMPRFIDPESMMVTLCILIARPTIAKF